MAYEGVDVASQFERWDLAAAYEAAALLQSPYALVLDSDAILSSVDNHCRTGRPSMILRLSESSEATLLAAEHVHEEICTRLPRLARSGVTELQLRACLEQRYLPHIKFVSLPAIESSDIEVARVMAVDESDAPTAALGLLVALSIVLSGDRHLRRTGFAPDQWRVAAGVAIHVGETERQLQAAFVVPALPVAGLVGGAKAAARKAPMATLLVGSALVVGGTVALKDPDRRRRWWKGAQPILMGYLELLAEAHEEHNAAVEAIRRAALPAPTEPSWPQLLARELVHELAPVGTPSLVERLDGWGAEEGSLRDAIRWTLKRHPSFVERSRGRWQLGRSGDRFTA